MKLWSQKSLSRIASTLGKPLYMDQPTALKDRLSYALICVVEVSVNDPLPENITVEYENGESFDQLVEYDWKPTACSTCSTFGHDEAQCPICYLEVRPTRVDKER